MYSVVLMMALSGGTEAVDFGHKGGGCSGCYGSCSGAVVSGCSCSGGHGHRMKKHGHGHRGHGCCGGYASSCYGGGCYGSSYGAVGCTGSYGSGYGAVGCTGSYGIGGVDGGVGCAGGGIVAPGQPYGTPAPMVTPEQPKVMPKGTPKQVNAAPATIRVNLPASARLTVDGAPTTSTSAQRTLVTPALELGNTYVYTLQAEVNGQIQTQQVQVTGGQVTEAAFSFPQGVASR